MLSNGKPARLPPSCCALLWILLQYLTQRWSGAIKPLALTLPADTHTHTYLGYLHLHKHACTYLQPCTSSLHLGLAYVCVCAANRSSRAHLHHTRPHASKTHQTRLRCHHKELRSGSAGRQDFLKRGQSWVQITAGGQPRLVIDLNALCVYPHTCTPTDGRERERRQHSREHTAIL